MMGGYCKRNRVATRMGRDEAIRSRLTGEASVNPFPKHWVKHRYFERAYRRASELLDELDRMA